MKWLWIFFSPIASWASPWAHERLENLSLEEKIGQLFIAPLSPLMGEKHFADWERLIDEFHIGNAILKQSDPATQIEFLRRLQNRVKIPLLIAADAEWGLGMRMSETISFPRNLTLGAVQDLSLIEEMGKWIGREAKRAGIHLNLAPVVDVNCNPLNPIIHMRSFGSDPIQVASRCRALIRGMRSEGLLTCAKHFPGHGDTSNDSHLSLPVLPFDMQRLRQVELIPFKAAIDEGVDLVMSGHLLIPAIDAYPVPLSSLCIQDLLRKDLGFRGIVITDALNMKALTDHWSVEEIAVKAYCAGHDLLLYGAHLNEDVDELMHDQIPRAFKALRLAFLEGRLDLKDLDERVLRILELKEFYAMAPVPPVSSLIDFEALALKRTLYREALTLIGGNIPRTPFVYVAIGGTEKDWIVQTLKNRGVEVVCIPLDASELPLIANRISGLHQVKGASDGFGLSQEMLRFIRESSFAVFFCSPLVLQLLPGFPALMAYENDPDAQEAAWDALQERLEPHGYLPASKTPRQ